MFVGGGRLEIRMRFFLTNGSSLSGTLVGVAVVVVGGIGVVVRFRWNTCRYVYL